MSNNIDNPKELTTDFKALEKTLLAVKNALKDLGAETSISGMEELSKDVKAVGGAFSAAKESLKLFGIESKSLSEIETKIQSVIEIVGGLQVAFKTLGKAGGWITVVATAIGGLISWLDKLEKKQGETLSRFNEEVEKSYSGLGDKVLTIKSLQEEWSKLGNNLDAQKKFITANKEAFDLLGVSINDVNDANKLLVSNTPLIIEALKLQARATAAKNLASKSYEEKLIAENQVSTIEKQNPSVMDHVKGNWPSLFVPAGGHIFNWSLNPAETVKQGRISESKETAVKKGEDFEYYFALSKNLSTISQSFMQVGGLNGNNNSVTSMQDDSLNGSGNGNNNSNERSNKDGDLKNYKDEILKVEEDLQRAKTDLKEDGTEKEIQLIQNEYDRKIAEINKQEEKLAAVLAKYGLSMPDEDKEKFQEQRSLAEKQKNKDTKAVEDNQAKKEEESLNVLLAKYQDYADQRKAIEEKFKKDIDALTNERDDAVKEGNTDKVKQLNGKITTAEQGKGKELLTHDFNALKENPNFTWAFDNIESTSTETLNVLLEQLNGINKSNQEIDDTKLKEYLGAIQKVTDELTTRNPVAALAKGQNQLTQANTRLAKAKKDLDQAEQSGDPEAVAKAKQDYADALIDVDKANKKVVKSQKEVNEKMGELFKNISGVGEAIGGQAGHIISLIGDIGSFVTTSISGVQKAGQAGAGALAAVEKASAILAIIQLAIQLIGKISSMMSDTHQEYEKFAKKLAEINKLRDAVNDYELAVLKAKQAEDNWFGGDELQSLKDAKVVNNKVKENYDEKINETQATYVNESGGGWGTKWFKEGFIPTTMIASGNVGGGLAAYKGLKGDGYDKDTTKAVDNLRIETRSAKKGALGSGIGGKSQKTEDLRTWAKNNDFGELFDENNMINKDAAQQIIDKYGDKLVGETKATLESLIELSTQYEEYQQQLQDYVSSLYEPLVDNFVDSLWAWYDEGTDALTSFKEKASDTFRDIVSDMIRTIVLKEIVGTYSEDVVGMYKEYAEGKLTEEQLMEKVAQRTDQMIDTYEEKLPVLQGIITTIGDGLDNAGIDIQKKPEEQEQTAEKGSFQTMSQETGSELLGQFTAIRIHTSNIHDLIKGLEREDQLVNNCLTAIEKNTFNTVSELKEVNSKLKQIKVEGIKVL